MKKENKIMFSFRIHKNLLNYLRIKSKSEYTTVSEYLSRLIIKDMVDDQMKIYERRQELYSEMIEQITKENGEPYFSVDYLKKILKLNETD